MSDDQHYADRPEGEGDSLGDMSESLDRAKWVQRASEAYSASTTYMESSVNNQWDTNLDNFRSIHSRSKTTKQRMFRPKTRSSIRAHEAALAAALFTNSDLINVTGVDPNNKSQAVSAKINKALMQHRLDRTIPWFMTAMGAYQDTLVYGVCISKTYWKYETEDITEFVQAFDDDGNEILDDDGEQLGTEEIVGTEVTKDEPAIDLIAPENFRFDPNADWRDPVSDSPYLIEQIPMYAGDIIERMGSPENNKTNAPSWIEYSLAEIIASAQKSGSSDQTRISREGDRVDPVDIDVENEFKTVWVHFNIYRENGIDMAYYTLGTTRLLSDPVPLDTIFKHGREAYTLGVSTVESHRNYPSALTELGSNLQGEINTLADQRYNNVRLVLNKRYLIRRQGHVDLQALANNRAGGGIMVDDVNADVRVIDTPDVTSSSYAEQDRLNQDMDELMGIFSPSSIQSNRAMNETVGGMNLMSSGANTAQEYIMRTFIETWVEPVLRALSKIEWHYETDETVLALAAGAANIERGVSSQNPELMDKLIKQDLVVTVNVGMGNTNPEQRMSKIMMAINATAKMPGSATETDWNEVRKEVYANAGYADGERFLKKPESEGGEKAPPPPPPPEVQIKQMELKAKAEESQAAREHEMNITQMRLQAEGQIEIDRMNGARELELTKLAQSQNIKLEELRAKVGIESSKDKTKRETEALRASLMAREFGIKLATGQGI